MNKIEQPMALYCSVIICYLDKGIMCCVQPADRTKFRGERDQDNGA